MDAIKKLGAILLCTSIGGLFLLLGFWFEYRFLGRVGKEPSEQSVWEAALPLFAIPASAAVSITLAGCFGGVLSALRAQKGQSQAEESELSLKAYIFCFLVALGVSVVIGLAYPGSFIGGIGVAIGFMLACWLATII